MDPEQSKSSEALKSNTLLIPCVRLHQAAELPVYHSAQAAGLDLKACFSSEPSSSLVLLPLQRVLIPTGIALAIPTGYEGQIRPRSGWALQYGITVLNSPGTIDSDYRGEIKILLINLGDEPVTISSGDRIAQLVIAPVLQATLQEVSVLEVTARGEGGYGHSGGMAKKR